ncbi:MAG: extracellular solute-binding protein family 3 [Actinotalea sp.]|nr:extracellular solute-binding protein family 3 [Actinotalea sp.]
MATTTASVVLLSGLAGCGVTIPADPDGTLDRVRGGVLRVGVSENPPWTVLPGSGGDGAPPTGTEPALVLAFAEQQGAEVEWTLGGEEPLVAALAEGELDLVVGGLTSASPWASHAALTVPYVTVSGSDGSPEPHAMATAMGENAFLGELERFLLAQEVRP